MKKTIVIEFLLLFVFCVALISGIVFCDYAAGVTKTYKELGQELGDSFVKESLQYIRKALSYGIPCLLAAAATLASIVIIAIKDFPCFKPLLDKLHAKREAHAVAKAEKAEADKQARIERLQSELDELNKNE